MLNLVHPSLCDLTMNATTNCQLSFYCQCGIRNLIPALVEFACCTCSEGGTVGVIPPGAGNCSKATALELIKACLFTSVDFELFADDTIHVLYFFQYFKP